MGLDSVEIIMAVEQTFGIEIPDADAEKLVTVGALHEYIVARTEAHAASDKSTMCPTAHVFYTLRQALESIGSTRRISPATPLRDVFPKWQTRRWKWREFERTLKLQVPQLERPVWLVALIWLASALIGYAASALVIRSDQAIELLTGRGSSEAFYARLSLAGLAGIVAVLLLFLATRPFRVTLPFRTVGEVCRGVALRNAGKFRNDPAQSWTSTSIWELLVTIIEEQLRIPRERIVPDANLVTDLGVS
jgi:acyl carrier protein